MKRLLIFIFLVLCFPGLSFGATYYVSQSGAGDGSAVGTPDSVADFNANVFGALTGDTVYFLGAITTEIDVPGGGGYLRGDYAGQECTINGTANGIHVTADDGTTIDGFIITNFTGRGIHATDSDDLVIKNCTISGGNDVSPDIGIHVQGLDNTLETGVEVTDNTIGTIASGENDTVGFNGISVQETSGAIIARNSVNTTNTVGIRHILGAGTDSTNTEIYENDIYGCYGGLLVSNADGVTIRNNKIRDGKGIGIGIAYDADNAKVYYNLIYNLATQSTNLWNGIDVNHDSQTGVVYGNTVYKVHGNSFVIDDDTAACDGWIIKNNIFDARENGSHSGVEEYPMRSNGDGITFTSDYNILYPHADQTDDIFYDGDGTTGSYTLAEVQAGNPPTGAQDANSDDSDPLFTNASGDDFTLQSGSPAIDAGELLSIHVEGWEDFKGTKMLYGDGVDIGAYERIQTKPSFPLFFPWGLDPIPYTGGWYTP